jgi:bacillithiol system protein YtxJ
MGLFSGLKSKDKTVFPWIELTTIEELESAIESSTSRAVLLFKHSTRCSISSMAKSRFENNWNSEIENCDLYYLDLIAHRDISNKIAEITGIEHQSPQAIVLKNKKVIYEATHSSIDAKEIEISINA